ncbi:hypothetical protein L596_030647 [Steinernema carpocapsae]|uniref:Ig-like domain-containing protein n=1 Tax=Steinernema carpocapsae TaxID=34508 RepID=A0A4U5LQ19_STECR|nr:hypothetical protein L596_030647 [Steinernema carpocapsae]
MSNGQAPTFLQDPKLRQNDDGSVTLECFLVADPTPEIKWFYNETELMADNRLEFELQDKGDSAFLAILRMRNLTDADTGDYRCGVANIHGNGSANFDLKLSRFSSPTFITQPKIKAKENGRVMVLEFQVKSALKPTFVWKRGDEVVAASDRLKIVEREMNPEEYYAALEITNPKNETDAGGFVCTVQNDSGKLFATFTVKFEVPQGAPTFTRKPQIIQKISNSGEPLVVFDVGFQSDINPEVVWISPRRKKMKETGRFKFTLSKEASAFTAQLELKDFKAKDSGVYVCNVKNQAGQANVELTLNVEEGDANEA